MREHERLESEKAQGRRIAERGDEVWGWNTPAGRLRAARRARMYIESLRLDGRGKVLEFGCGTGLFSGKVAPHCAELVSIDLSEDLLNVARRKNPDPRGRFVCADAEHLPFPDGTFDAVFGSSILHHLDVKRALGEAFRVLKPGGRLVFTEPNMLNPQIAVQKNVPCVKEWAGDTPDETAFFRWPMARELARAGFCEIDVRPFDFLHPSISERLARAGAPWLELLERLPLIREIAGSLRIAACRPK